jgi:hypothetical protein
MLRSSSERATSSPSATALDGGDHAAYNTVPDSDGDVTITFSAEDPDDGTYWMPVIAGEPYYFIVRHDGTDLDALPPGPCDRT